MKKSICFISILFLLLVSTVAFPQQKSYEIMLGGGIAVPLSPDEFKDGWNMGFNGIGGIGFFLSSQLMIRC